MVDGGRAGVQVGDIMVTKGTETRSFLCYLERQTEGCLNKLFEYKKKDILNCHKTIS